MVHRKLLTFSGSLSSMHYFVRQWEVLGKVLLLQLQRKEEKSRGGKQVKRKKRKTGRNPSIRVYDTSSAVTPTTS
jgi:hypothetical protein